MPFPACSRAMTLLIFTPAALHSIDEWVPINKQFSFPQHAGDTVKICNCLQILNKFQLVTNFYEDHCKGKRFWQGKILMKLLMYYLLPSLYTIHTMQDIPPTHHLLTTKIVTFWVQNLSSMHLYHPMHMFHEIFLPVSPSTKQRWCQVIKHAFAVPVVVCVTS